jgi:hypothetical protein
MDATRVRFGAMLEWVLAAACVAAAVAVAAIGASQFRAVRAVVPVNAAEAPAAEPPAGIPSRAVAVPLLLLNSGTEIKVGDRLGDVTARLRRSSQLLSESRDEVPSGRRLTRFYNDVGVQFMVVFESAPGGDPRVSAIYVR